MAVLDLVLYPDIRLKKKSKQVLATEIKSLQSFMDDMLETMYASKGLGLAAVQVGVLKRIIAMDIAQGSVRYDGTHNPDAKPDPLFLINPEIIEKSEKFFNFEEGCLSFPAQFAEVKRPEKIKVKFLDYHAKEKVMEFEKLASICVQHEIDHLNGIVFVDYISKIKRDLIIKRMEKYKKRQSAVF
jgi:peptide deformylase